MALAYLHVPLMLTLFLALFFFDSAAVSFFFCGDLFCPNIW